MRLVIARCEVDYTGRLAAHLAMAVRLIMIKADGSVSVHADDRAYKPLNWMSAPCTLTVAAPPADRESDLIAVWQVHNPAGEKLRILIAELLSDQIFQLGTEPGLVKDGVEAHLQELLAEHPQALGEGWTTVRREHPTAIGPVDLLCRDAEGVYVAVEVKRKGEIAGVEQLSRYLDLLNRDPLLGQVRGVIAAQVIRAQARVVADDRGIGCVLVDYDSLRGIDDPESRLF